MRQEVYSCALLPSKPSPQVCCPAGCRMVAQRSAIQQCFHLLDAEHAGRLLEDQSAHQSASWATEHSLQMHCPAGLLTADQHSEIRECFHLLDADGSGELDADEMAQALHMLGIEVGHICNCCASVQAGQFPQRSCGRPLARLGLEVLVSAPRKGRRVSSEQQVQPTSGAVQLASLQKSQTRRWAVAQLQSALYNPAMQECCKLLELRSVAHKPAKFQDTHSRCLTACKSPTRRQ